MKEIIYPYIFLCWVLVKTGIVKPTPRNYTIMVSLGLFMATCLFFGHTLYAPVDYTSSSVVRARAAILSSVVESIEEYHVDHNQFVKEGDLVYTLVDVDYAQRVDSLEAQIGALTTNIEQTQADLGRLLAAKEYVPERELLVVRSRLRADEFKLIDLQAQLEQARFDAGRMEVVAPFDGYVTRLDTAAGSLFGNLQLWNPATRVLEMRIPDQLWSRVKPGQFAEFQVDAYPGHIFRGRVHSIAPATGEARGSHLSAEAPVRQQLQNLSANLGRTVLIEFEDPPGIYIPIGARGSAWISVDKPHPFWGLLDMLGAATVRLNAIKSYLGAL